MPAPTNTAATTAIDLGTFPASVSQNVHDAGTTYSVWYKFTATAAGVVGVFGFGDVTTYQPSTYVYTGPAAAPTPYLDGFFGFNVPIQFPVTASETYYLRFLKNGANPSPAVLLIEAEYFVNGTAPIGSILISDDTDGFPWAIVDADTGEVLRFINDFPAGESGFQIATGEVCHEDIGANGLQFFDDELTLVASVGQDLSTTGSSAGGAISGAGLYFYVSNPTTGAQNGIAAGSVGRYSSAGVLLDQFGSIGTVGTAIPSAIAVDPDETIIYSRSSVANSPIKRWDIGTDLALSDLVAGLGASYVGRRQILCLNDGTVLALYTLAAPKTCIVNHYSSAGALLDTYDFSSEVVAGLLGDNQIALSVNRLTSFWVWLKIGNGLSRLSEIRVSDGVVLRTWDRIQYEVGTYQGAVTATPSDRFGHSESCPFMILSMSVVGGGGAGAPVIGPLVWVHWPRLVP